VAVLARFESHTASQVQKGCFFLHCRVVFWARGNFGVAVDSGASAWWTCRTPVFALFQGQFWELSAACSLTLCLLKVPSLAFSHKTTDQNERARCQIKNHFLAFRP